MTLPDIDWIPSTGVKPTVYGYVLASGDLVPWRFDQICTAVHGRRLLPPRTPQVRDALARYLRSRFMPEQRGAAPWSPEADPKLAPRFRPYRSIIRPLLAHSMWDQIQIVAAPITLHSPQHHAAGSFDAIGWLPDGSLALLALHTCPKDSLPDHRAVQAELGAGVAALTDLYLQWVSHCIAVWARADETFMEYLSPDACLTSWVQTVEAHGFGRRLEPGQAPDPSIGQGGIGQHSAADGPGDRTGEGPG